MELGDGQVSGLQQIKPSVFFRAFNEHNNASQNAQDSSDENLAWEEVSTEHIVQDEWKHLIVVPSNATIADNYAFIFVAKNCRKVSEQELDDTEFLNVRKYTYKEIEDMVDNGKFQQAVHIMAWLLANRGSRIE